MPPLALWSCRCADCVAGFVQSLMGSVELGRREGGLPCVAIDEPCCEPAVLSERETIYDRCGPASKRRLLLRLPSATTGDDATTDGLRFELRRGSAAVEECLAKTVDGALLLPKYIEAVEAANAEPEDEEAREQQESDVERATREISDLLCVVCPNPACKAIQDPDPSGCIAVVCQHCKTAYCWMCFELCGKDAHPHAMEAHRMYFPPRPLIKSWHKRWRWLRVEEYASDTDPTPAVASS